MAAGLFAGLAVFLFIASRCRLQLPEGDFLTRGARAFTPLVGVMFPEDARVMAEKKLAWAGIEGLAATDFLAAKLMAAVGLPVAGVLAAPVLGFDPIFAVLLAGAGYMLPDYFIQRKVTARQKEIKKYHLEFSTLLATVLEAGGGDIYGALVQVGNRLGGELGREIDRAAHEIRSGRRKPEALTAMADRCGVDELQQLIRVIIQAERYGTKVADAIKQHAAQVRMLRRYDAERVANEAAVKMVFPMLVLIIGPLMFVLAYPAFQQFAKILK